MRNSVTIEDQHHDQGSLHRSYKRVVSPRRNERKAKLHVLSLSMREDAETGSMTGARRRSPKKLMDESGVKGLLL